MIHVKSLRHVQLILCNISHKMNCSPYMRNKLNFKQCFFFKTRLFKNICMIKYDTFNWYLQPDLIQNLLSNPLNKTNVVSAMFDTLASTVPMTCGISHQFPLHSDVIAAFFCQHLVLIFLWENINSGKSCCVSLVPSPFDFIIQFQPLSVPFSAN